MIELAKAVHAIYSILRAGPWHPELMNYTCDQKEL